VCVDEPQGRLPLSLWRTYGESKRCELRYQENAIVDQGGFIVARSIARPSDGEWKAIRCLLEEASPKPECLTVDSVFSVGELRKHLEERAITAYIPIHPTEEQSTVAQGSFSWKGDHLVRPQGEERNPSPKYRQETKKRRTTIDGVFAPLDGLGWACCQPRGLWKVDGEGFLAGLAYNILKGIRKLKAIAGISGQLLNEPVHRKGNGLSGGIKPGRLSFSIGPLIYP